MQETELVRKTLPRAFVEYVESKLSNGTGREHLCKQLGSMDEVLNLLRYYFETDSFLKTARKIKVSKMTIYRLIEDINPYLQDIKAYLTYEDEIRPRDFRAFPIIQEWERKIRRSGKLSQLSKISVMQRVCGYKARTKKGTPITTGFKCRNPEKFDLKMSQEFVDVYLAENPDKIEVPNHIRLAIRHFLQVAQGIHIPRGFGGQYGLSGDKGKIGKYAHVRLSEEEIASIHKVLKNDAEGQERGYDIGFEIGLDTCSRAFAIGSLAKKWIPEEIPEDATQVIIRVFEPKVKEGDEHMGKRGLLWKKHILRSTWVKLRAFIKKHGRRELVFIERMSIHRQKHWLDDFRAFMKTVYTRAGIDERYFHEHPIHGLRHAGAQRLLEITGWNYGLVARIGGWKSEDTLKNWYGAMPDHIVQKGAEKALNEIARRAL